MIKRKPSKQPEREDTSQAGEHRSDIQGGLLTGYRASKSEGTLLVKGWEAKNIDLSLSVRGKNTSRKKKVKYRPFHINRSFENPCLTEVLPKTKAQGLPS